MTSIPSGEIGVAGVGKQVYFARPVGPLVRPAVDILNQSQAGWYLEARIK